MAQAERKIDERPHRGLATSLVIGIMLSMGPLFGAIISVFVMMRRSAEARALALEGLPIESTPFPFTPVVVGFCAFPVGLLLVWFSVMRLSHDVARRRQARPSLVAPEK